jgi:DNA-binding transcriptional regulator YiaG
LKAKTPDWVPKPKRTAAQVAKEKKDARMEEGGELAARRTALVNPSTSRTLTQGELAELMGVKRNTVTRWENGRYEIQPWVWKLLEYLEADRKIFPKAAKQAS